VKSNRKAKSCGIWSRIARPLFATDFSAARMLGVRAILGGIARPTRNGVRRRRSLRWGLSHKECGEPVGRIEPTELQAQHKSLYNRDPIQLVEHCRNAPFNDTSQRRSRFRFQKNLMRFSISSNNTNGMNDTDLQKLRTRSRRRRLISREHLIRCPCGVRRLIERLGDVP